MNGPATEEIMAQAMLVNGSALLLEAITDHHVRRAHGLPPRSITPAKLLWSFRAANNQWNGTPLESGYAKERREANERLIAATAERDAFANSRRVSRDPCPKCAVRADIGCKHITTSHRRETDAHTQGAMS